MELPEWWDFVDKTDDEIAAAAADMRKRVAERHRTAAELTHPPRQRLLFPSALSTYSEFSIPKPRFAHVSYT